MYIYNDILIKAKVSQQFFPTVFYQFVCIHYVIANANAEAHCYFISWLIKMRCAHLSEIKTYFKSSFPYVNKCPEAFRLPVRLHTRTTHSN